ncbi:hypothetical protein PVK06_023585 [Gossypium arboreum]|uniref:Uncharacterized protein n=1 Tax=Gossypium arboreum TaxID=29729 RepID=A0ABR0PBP6_GOSAR|nr:hypothetical protein PVK06_023585 [Gossypium arboreum]
MLKNKSKISKPIQSKLATLPVFFIIVVYFVIEESSCSSRCGVAFRKKIEVAQLKIELSQWDAKLNTRLKELRDDSLGEIKSELQNLFEQYLGNPPSIRIVGAQEDKGKSILGGPPLGFLPKETLTVSLMMDLGCMGIPSCSSNMERTLCSYKLECLKFDGFHFRG